MAESKPSLQKTGSQLQDAAASRPPPKTAFFRKLLAREPQQAFSPKRAPPLPDFVELEKHGKYPPVTAGDAINFAQRLACRASKNEGDKDQAEQAVQELEAIKQKARGRVAKRFLQAVIPEIGTASGEICKQQTGVDARMNQLDEKRSEWKGFFEKFKLNISSATWQNISGRLVSVGFSATSLGLLHSWTAERFGSFASYVADALIAFTAFSATEGAILLGVLLGKGAVDGAYNRREERVLGRRKRLLDRMSDSDHDSQKIKTLRALADTVLENIQQFYPDYSAALAKKYGSENPADGAKAHAAALADRMRQTDGVYFDNREHT